MAFAIALAAPVFAENTDYNFTLRGVVDVKTPTKSIAYVTVTQGSDKALSETKNQNIGFSISTAKIYKITPANGKKLVSWTSIKMGDEVVMKGRKVGGTFKVTELVINNRNFEIVGKVREVHTDLKTIVVFVAHSSYREAGIKGKEITLNYNDSTVCKRLGSSVDCSTIAEKNQVIKAVGSVTGTNQVYELSKVWDNFK